MIVKSIALVIIVIIGSVAVVEGQTAVLANQGASARGDVAQPEVVTLGWNTFHIAFCQTVGTSLYVYPLENVGVVYFVTNVPTSQAVLAGACQTGNLIAIHVSDIFGDWDSIFTYTFR